MKPKIFLWLLCSIMLCWVACEDNEPSFSFSNSVAGQSITIDAEAGAETTLSFNSSQAWQASVDASWLQVFPESGEAGDYSLELSVTSANSTGETRSATLTLTSGSLTQSFTISQDEYIRVEQTAYEVPAAETDFEINFFTTIDQEEFAIYSGGESWITDQLATRATDETGYYIALRALPNESNQSRTATFYFVKEPFDDEHADRYILATATVTQAGRMTGESTDYSADKTVRTIQSHSAGNGIPLVLMGDGFIDQEIADGYYDQVMDQAVENLFTEEPIRSLKDYFDIYAVTAVSPHNSFGAGYVTALGCGLEGGNSTLVWGDDETVQEYVQCVEGIELDETLTVVILNTTAYAGTTYNYWYASGQPVNFAIAYCPVIESLESENFRRVLVHEVVGHGFGKLDDEYSYEEMGTIPDDAIASTQQQQQDFGWWQNVDFTPESTAVLWSEFLNDSRYADQGLGVYEGACTYMYGAYRSTEESMMRNNIMGFNAPSRQAIYDQTIQRGEGRTPDYEEFVTFDLQTYTPVTRSTAGSPTRPFARPRTVTPDQPLGQQ